MFAITETNEIYSWGLNERGQLGPVFQGRECLTPERVEFFSDKNIIQISCGKYNCLALSSKGEIYGWGKLIGDKLATEKSKKDMF